MSNILVVEDDEINRLVVEAMLRNLGYGCEFAIDGNQALSAVAARTFDLVFLDPPYGKGLVDPSFRAVAERRLLVWQPRGGETEKI